MADDTFRGGREIGAISARIDLFHDAQTRMETKIDTILQQLPTHHARIEANERSISALWRWKDSLTGKVIGLVGACGTVAAGIAWLISGR